MNYAEMLINFRKRRGLNKTDLARRLKVSLAYIQHVEAQRMKPFPIDKCRSIAQILSLNEDETKSFIETAIRERARPEVTEWLNDKSQLKEIPVIDWVLANRFEEVQDPFPPGVADEHVITTAKGDNMFALKVKSDCMEPEFVEGDIIIINPNIEPVHGNYVVVRDVESNEATFKQLKKKAEKYTCILLTRSIKTLSSIITKDTISSVRSSKK